MRRISLTLCVLIFPAIATIALAASAAAQTEVVGTGDPDIDVPAVQAAVDQGGEVILRGHFSFDRPPTVPPGETYSRMVTVSREVVISGTQDENGELTTIEGGDLPFAVEALGLHVTIQGLRFVRPKEAAINVYAVSALVIAYCRIEGVEPLRSPDFPPDSPPLANGIFVGFDRHPPSTARPGRPENFSGTLSIFNNDIDMGGTADDNTLGIVIFSVGISPNQEVNIYVSGNSIRNTTERAINIIKVGGRAYIVRNVITTGATPGATRTAVDPDVIHAVGSGSYLIAHNSIDCAWATGAGIHVQGPPSLGEVIQRALVVDNDVTMSAPEGTVFGDNSAGIDIRGDAKGNVVLNNRIRGRARAALAVIVQSDRVPGNNTFFLNDLEGFQSSLADVFVGPGVTNTLIVGRQRSVEDHGIGTIIVPLPRKSDDEDRHDDGKDDRP